METTPLVSVVTPVFDRAHLVTTTIDSVRRQTHPRWELLLVDDGSTDGTWDVLREQAAADPRLRLFRNDRNRGAPFSRNRALRACRGDYVNFLDSDDELVEDKLALQVAELDRGDGLDVVVSHTLRRVVDSGVTRRLDAIEPTSCLAHDFVAKAIQWRIHAPLWRLDFLRRQGGFVESLGSGQDYEYYARAILRGPSAAYLHRPLAIINDHALTEDPAKIRNRTTGTAALVERIRSREVVRRHVGRSPIGRRRRLAVRRAIYRDLWICLKRARRDEAAGLVRLIGWYLRTCRHDPTLEPPEPPILGAEHRSDEESATHPRSLP